MVSKIPSQQHVITSRHINEISVNQSQKVNGEQHKDENNFTIENEKNIEAAVKGLNDFLKPLQTSILFQLHEELNEYYVTVVDQETKEVVREIPPKKMLDIYAAMAELAGILVDKKV